MRGIPAWYSFPVFMLSSDHILARLAGIDTPEIKGKCEHEKMLASRREILSVTYWGNLQKWSSERQGETNIFASMRGLLQTEKM
jgi:hypothetical protein